MKNGKLNKWKKGSTADENGKLKIKEKIIFHFPLSILKNKRGKK